MFAGETPATLVVQEHPKFVDTNARHTSTLADDDSSAVTKRPFLGRRSGSAQALISSESRLMCDE
jgi:hypothetical protein